MSMPHEPTPAPDPAQAAASEADAPAEGHPVVGRTEAALEQLDGLAVDEHVPLFAQVHQDLRRALDQTPQASED